MQQDRNVGYVYSSNGKYSKKSRSECGLREPG